jgi:hypothetical protein
MLQKVGAIINLTPLMSLKLDFIQHHYKVEDNNNSLHLDMLFDFKDSLN